MESKNISNLQEAYLQVCENVFRSRSSGAASADSALNAADMHKTVANSPETSKSDRKRHRDAAARSLVTSRRMRKKENQQNTNEEYVIDYLISEGYTDNYDSAVIIYESMSDEWLYSILEVTGWGKVPFHGDTSNRGMPLNPSNKLYRKKINLETGIEREEDRIREKHGATHVSPYVDDDNEDPDAYGYYRPKQKPSRGQQNRDAAAKRAIANSPKIKKLQGRMTKISDVDRNEVNKTYGTKG